MGKDVGAQRRCLPSWRAASVREDFPEEGTGMTILAELPQRITREYPITTPRRLTYEHTLRRSHFHSRLPTTGAVSIAMD